MNIENAKDENDHSSIMPDLKRINQEAIAWFTRLNDRASPADRQNFERWFNADAAHASAYQHVVATWSSIDEPGSEVAAEEAAKLNDYLKAVQLVRARRARRNMLAGTAVSLFALVAGFYIWLDHPHFLTNMQADYVSERSERRIISLPDGSQVVLDADSALAFQTSDTVRHAKLLRGMAYFDVKHSKVPFEVEAADGTTRVTGTAFSVELLNKEVIVNLERGEVIVASATQNQQVKLIPGESVTYNVSGVEPVRPVVIEEALSWREGRLIFDNARLQDVIDQIGRYHNGRIVLMNASLADYRVSGNLPLDETLAALSSLQSTVGFNIHEVGSRLIIIR
ncbi:FecR family protein [Brucellaceae bacterium C25G]